jgi:heme-degrading monooxygenase HmoA
MLIKWIVCNVPENKKVEFSYAQEQWESLNNIDGFLGQIGGWDLNTLSKAGIISFWRDQLSYQLFMEHKHDKIFKANEQKNTYESISVEIFNKKLNISEYEITQFLRKTEILRIANCIVKEDKKDHFETMQKDVWNEGMSKYQEMLAGVFCKNNQNKYLVVSLWGSIDSHQKYMENTLPSLVEKSKIKDDLVQIHGTVLKLDKNWSVL